MFGLNLKINKLHLVSVHGMSSLRAGKGDEYHTDYLGKLKNFKNIFINDASILPGNTGESPQASIMSFGKNNIKNTFFKKISPKFWEIYQKAVLFFTG